jgi:hypothetical protein
MNYPTWSAKLPGLEAALSKAKAAVTNPDRRYFSNP